MTTCTSNLHQIHLAREMYKQDYEVAFPAELRRLLPNYLKDKRLLLCPNDTLVEQGGWNWVGAMSQGIPPKDGRPPQSYAYTFMFDVHYPPLGMTPENKERVLQTAGYVVCQLHGDYVGTAMTAPAGKEFPVIYKGLTLRLCMDGSVRRFYLPKNDGHAAFFSDLD